MLSVTAGGPGLVAVGWEWTPTGGNANAAIGGGDLDAAVWTSSDGVAWSRVVGDDAALGGEGFEQMLSVTAGGPGLVAVGSVMSSLDGSRDAAAWASPDGVTWTRVRGNDAALGGEGFQQMFDVTAGGPGLVAVGMDSAGGDMDAAVWTSSDGLTWSRMSEEDAALGGADEQVMASVSAGGPGLVAVGMDSAGGGADAAVWTSPDGVTWTRVPGDEAVFGGVGRQEMASVSAGGPGLVAVGSDASGPGGDVDAAVWTSPDGVTWTRIPGDETVFGGASDQMMLSVTAGGPGLVAVGMEVSRPDGDPEAAVWIGVRDD
ncbi:MAG: hypothetical protein GWP04_08925 [Gammaproteobacteria bacterium]|nr:hypothetical protein [Gammaproteobacteria bacterium]